MHATQKGAGGSSLGLPDTRVKFGGQMDPDRDRGRSTISMRSKGRTPVVMSLKQDLLTFSSKLIDAFAWLTVRSGSGLKVQIHFLPPFSPSISGYFGE